MSSIKYFRLSFGWVAFCLSPCVMACSFAGLEHEILFSPGSTRLDTSQVVELASWFVEKRDAVNATGGIYRADVFAAAIKGNSRSHATTSGRLLEVTGLLKTLSAAVPIPIEASTDEVGPRSVSAPSRLDTVIATVQPACAETISCCK